MYYQTKFGSKRISNSKDTVEIVIFWSHELLQWPWSFCMSLWLMRINHNTKFENKIFDGLEDIIWTSIDILTFAVTLTLTAVIPFFTEHPGLWCCITTPSLVTKCFMVQKISSGQTFTDILNLCCDLDLEHSNPIFPKDTPAYDVVLSN